MSSIFLGITVPFRSIGPSRVTGPVVLAEIWRMSHVTGTMDACDKWFSDERKKFGITKPLMDDFLDEILTLSQVTSWVDDVQIWSTGSQVTPQDQLTEMVQ